jgi:hypothetical protein
MRAWNRDIGSQQMRRIEMDARLYLAIITLWISMPAVSLAAKPAAGGKTNSANCETSVPPPQWTVTDIGKGEYGGIIANRTQMKLQYYPQGNPGEWQISFSKETTTAPPGVEILHFIKVCGGSDLGEDLPDSNAAYLYIAYEDIMKGGHNYFAAMGYLDGVPTLALLTISAPDATDKKRRFNLVFVKTKQARSARFNMGQGGVLHGQEN